MNHRQRCRVPLLSLCDPWPVVQITLPQMGTVLGNEMPAGFPILESAFRLVRDDIRRSTVRWRHPILILVICQGMLPKARFSGHATPNRIDRRGGRSLHQLTSATDVIGAVAILLLAPKSVLDGQIVCEATDGLAAHDLQKAEPMYRSRCPQLAQFQW